MRNIFNPLLVLVLLLVTVALAFAQPAQKTLAIPGIAQKVTISRDERSIPYIDARTDADLYFAQGYITASDRLWQMDLMRRLARGETAELFGKMTLEEDKRWRRFGFAKIAEDSLQYLTPELRAALDSYARGVNAYIAGLDDATMPVEFKILQYKPREWQATDTIVIGKILADALSSTWQNDLLRSQLTVLPKDKFADLTNPITDYDVVLFGDDKTPRAWNRPLETSPFISTGALAEFIKKEDELRRNSLSRVGLYAEDLAASNNWVISGKRTADGKPILANDPHLAPTAPGIWYLAHLTTPGHRVSGVTFPGVPGIVLGHNAYIAWGATNVGPDVQDLYIETFNADGKYQTPAGWERPTVRREEIKVRTNPTKTDTEVVSLDVEETRNGVVIREEAGKKYALKWTARDPKNNEFEAFYYSNRARDWMDFLGALRKYGGSTQNFVFADVKGNIGWYAAGRIPIRRRGDGSMPYDGASNDGDWTGYIPFEDLPNLYNPKQGFIVTANQRITGTSYKYSSIVSRDTALPWRARRIYDRLKGNSKVTMDAVRDIQYDVVNMPLSMLAADIMKIGGASAESQAVLKGWDGRMAPESRTALLTNEIRGCLANKMAEASKPAPSWIIRERILFWAVHEKSARWLPPGYTDYAAFIGACDTESRAALGKRYGADPAKWTWSAAWKSSLNHPMASVPFIGAQFATPNVPIEGSGQTPNVGSYVSMRHIASPGNWDATRHVIPLGESGDPRSPHYKDQFELWRTGAPAIFPFSKEAVDKAAKEVWILEPGNIKH
jgi:penicillin G amidase